VYHQSGKSGNCTWWLQSSQKCQQSHNFGRYTSDEIQATSQAGLLSQLQPRPRGRQMKRQASFSRILRFGRAVTLLLISEDYAASTGMLFKSKSSNSAFSYDLEAPTRWIAGMAFVLCGRIAICTILALPVGISHVDPPRFLLASV
jgi:hypothetical protein